MNSRWEKLYDRSKDRRYAMLFFTVMLNAIFGLLVAMWLSEDFFSEHPTRVGEIVGAIALALLFVPVLRAAVDLFQNRRRRHRGHNCSPLASDELLKARSKLRNTIKVLRPPEPQAPDLDLKY
jgi:hypothetical protein